MNICTDVEIIWYNDLQVMIIFNNMKLEINIYLDSMKIIYSFNNTFSISKFNNIYDLLNKCKFELKGYQDIYYDIERKVLQYII